MSLATATMKPIREEIELRKLFTIGPLAILASILVNLTLYATAAAAFPSVAGWPGAGSSQIVGSTVIYLLIASAVFAAIVRMSSKPIRTYRVVATVALLLSLALPVFAGFGFGPPGVPPAPAPAVVTLSLMHLAAYAISVPLFTRLTRAAHGLHE